MSVTLDTSFFTANSDAIKRRQELERPQEFARDCALLVGINRYRNGIQSLSSPVSDATRIARLLAEEHGYAYHLCVEDVTLDHLKELFQVKLPHLVGKDDRFLFYFAGHGIALENDAEGPAGYLVPEDADPTDRTTFLAMVDLLAWLDALPCRHMLAILDCCFAGAIRWSSRRHITTYPVTMHQERYARLIESSAWQALTSAASDQTALDLLAGDVKRGVYQAEDADDCHSPFAHALLRALAGEGDIWPSTGDGVITATELYLYLFQQVKAQSQTPGLWPLRKHTRGEFIFLKPGHKLQLQSAPPLTAEFSPWRGLEPYRTSEANLFFGRTQAIQELVNLVGEHPLTAVVGVSGAGKTSLLQAGLRPHFQTRGWHVPEPIRPGATPMHTLVTALQQMAGNAGQDVATLLADWFRAHPQQRLLLIVDPLEELIIECHDERQRADFQRVLAQVVRDHPHQMRVVVTLRADFEHQFGESPLKPLWQAARYSVPSMTQAELREVIEQPAAERAFVFEPPDLVDALINAVVGEPGALPLLAFTLQEMYMRYIHGAKTDRALTPAHDRRIGEVRGALNQSATAVYEGLPDDDHRRAMQQVMLRTISLEGGHLARRRVPLIELDFPSTRQNEQVREVRARMEAAYLFVPGEEAGRAYVEPAHDALVRHWDKMAEWQRMAGDSLPFHRRLSQAAWEWSQLARRTGPLADWWQTLRALVRSWLQRWSLVAPEQAAGLVWDDEIRSSQLDQLLASPAAAWLSRIERAFALASIEQRQRNRRLRTTVLALLVTLLMAATIAAGVAIDNYIQTEAQRGETLLNESRLLTSLAHQQRTVDPVASIHLALRALPQDGEQRPYWPDAELALTQAMNASRERGHLAVANALAEGQVAFDHDAIAVGSQGVQLVDLEMRQVTPITDTAVALNGVAWGTDGRLLAYDAHQVYVWQDERWRASPVFAGTLSCARWRPGLPEIAICTTRGLQWWNLQEDETQVVWDARIDDAAWARDGSKLAAWDEQDSLLIWDAMRGAALPRQAAHPAHINDAVWSPDGQTLVSVSASLTENVKLWSAAADWSPVVLPAHSGDVLGAHFISSTQTVTPTQFVTWSTDGTVRLWDSGGQLRQTFDPEAGPLARAGVAFNSDHTRFLILLETGSAQVVALKESTAARTMLAGHERPIVAAGWYGAYVATASRDGTVRVWDTDEAGGSERRVTSLMVLYGHQASPDSGRAGVLGVRWQPDGTLASYGEDGTFRLWQIFDQQGQPRCRTARPRESDSEITYCFGLSQALTGHDGEIKSVRWLGNDQLLTTGRDGTARRWSLATGKHEVLPDAPDEYRTALWDPGGEAILTFYARPETPEQQDGTLWHAGTQDVIARVPGPIREAVWQPGMLLVSGEEGQARIVDPATGTATPLAEQSALVNDAQVHGDLVALADQEGQVGVWERTRGVRRWLRNEGDARWADRVQWHPDGARLASAQSNGIVVWDAATGQPVWTWLDQGVASAVAFSPDGRQLAAAITIEGVSELAVFDAERGDRHRIQRFSRHPIVGVQWIVGREWDDQDFHRPLFNVLPRRLTGAPAPGDGTRLLLLTWGNDGSVRLWDVGRKAEVWRAEEGTTSLLNAAAVSPDGAHIASVGMSGVMRVWSAPTLAPATWPQIIAHNAVLTRELTEQQRVSFGLEATEEGRPPP